VLEITQWIPIARRIGAARNASHAKKTTNGSIYMAPDSEVKGIAGELAFMRETGWMPNLSTNGHTDGGADFYTLVGSVDVKTAQAQKHAPARLLINYGVRFHPDWYVLCEYYCKPDFSYAQIRMMGAVQYSVFQKSFYPFKTPWGLKRAMDACDLIPWVQVLSSFKRWRNGAND
jgi:hypothetical protein